MERLGAWNDTTITHIPKYLLDIARESKINGYSAEALSFYPKLRMRGLFNIAKRTSNWGLLVGHGDAFDNVIHTASGGEFGDDCRLADVTPVVLAKFLVLANSSLINVLLFKLAMTICVAFVC